MCARERPAQARAQSQHKINYAGVIFTLLCVNTDTIASDFEEHLGQGLGVRCPLCIEIWIVAVYCEEEGLKWKINSQMTRHVLCLF